jgi:hypothetical protein
MTATRPKPLPPFYGAAEEREVVRRLIPVAGKVFMTDWASCPVDGCPRLRPAYRTVCSSCLDTLRETYAGMPGLVPDTLKLGLDPPRTDAATSRKPDLKIRSLDDRRWVARHQAGYSGVRSGEHTPSTNVLRAARMPRSTVWSRGVPC